MLALAIGAGTTLDWSPRRGHLLAASDRLVILATRRGLSRFLSAR